MTPGPDGHRRVEFDWDRSPLFEDATTGARLLDDVEAFLSRFVVYPGEPERVAHVLWIAHCWFMDAWDSTPRIAFLSPEPGSGKSRALEVTEPLVPRPVHAVNATSAALFRKVSDQAGPPTILFDEIDTIFGPKAKENEELRGLLNAGHRRGATALRCVIRGKSVELEELPAYCAVALAGLDDLPDTIATRSVIVRMRRRAPDERVEPWRLRINGAEGQKLGDRLRAWSEVMQAVAASRWPEMPAEITDRNADVWEALLAVADLAGGDWPDRARRNSVTLVTRPRDDGGSLGVVLLRDLRAVFSAAGGDKLPTDEILRALIDLDESPWGDLRGKELDARGLSRRLGKYGVQRKTLRVGERVFKGYDAADLADPWSRYLSTGLPVTAAGVAEIKGKDQLLSLDPPSPGDNSVTTVTRSQAADGRNRVTDVTDTRPSARDSSGDPPDDQAREPQCQRCGEVGTEGYCDACISDLEAAS